MSSTPDSLDEYAIHFPSGEKVASTSTDCGGQERHSGFPGFGCSGSLRSSGRVQVSTPVPVVTLSSNASRLPSGVKDCGRRPTPVFLRSSSFCGSPEPSERIHHKGGGACRARSEYDVLPVRGPGYFKIAGTSERELRGCVALPIVDPHVRTFAARRRKCQPLAVGRRNESAACAWFGQQRCSLSRTVHPHNGVGGTRGGFTAHINEGPVH